jgi:uncharacterized membrane protein
MIRSKFLVIVLITSLTFNLAVIGYTVAKIVFAPANLQSAMHISPRWAYQLPPERRKELRPLLEQQYKQTKAQQSLLMQKQSAVQTALTQKDFDQIKLAEALAELRAALESSQAQSHQHFEHFVAKLTTTEREFVAKKIGNRPNGRHRPGGFRDRPWDR